MWYWEVLFKTKEGALYTLTSTSGYATKEEAYQIYSSSISMVKMQLTAMCCTRVLSETIVFKTKRL